MFLFPENSFIALAVFSKLHLRFWEFPFAKSLEGRCRWSYQKQRSLQRYFCSKYCC